MKEKQEEKKPVNLKIPGFLRDDEATVGLGDLIKRVTTSVGIKPCEPCNKRAQILNTWMTISKK